MNFTIIEFERRPKGEKYVDWVHYGGAGTDIQYSTIWARVKDLKPAEGANDLHVVTRWEAVSEAYEAWQAGTELPETGTPIGAWPALSRTQLEAFRMGGFKSVEEVAEMNDTHMGRVKLPDVRGFKQMAQDFLAAQGTSDMAEKVAAQEAQIAELMAKLDAMSQPVEEVAEVPEEPSVKRGPGRPRKDAA